MIACQSSFKHFKEMSMYSIGDVLLEKSHRRSHVLFPRMFFQEASCRIKLNLLDWTLSTYVSDELSQLRVLSSLQCQRVFYPTMSETDILSRI